MKNTLDPKKSAIVLVDLQKDTVSRFAKSSDFLANVVRVLDYARSVGMPVFLAQTRRHPGYIDESTAITDQSLQGGKSHKDQGILVEGAPGTDFVDELKRQPSDFVIDKRRGNAFLATNLDMYLRHLGIDTVLAGGISTNAGVENTVRDGKDRDYNMVVLSDCCSANSDEAHDYCIQKVFPRVARVMTADEAIDKLKEGP
jgi:nicotinamidase-related amidase